MLADQHTRLAQLDRPTKERTLTARNYDSAIKALGSYIQSVGSELPTKSVLESWRDGLIADGKSVRTANARLAGARKLLRAVADDVTDITIKTVLRDWASVEDAKQTALADEDKTESDYGKRFTLESVKRLIKSPNTRNLKGLRDRALIAVMLGAGLRVSEAANLTMRDMFSTINESGQQGIKVVRGKHNKTRVVVLNGWNSWVIKAVQAYTDALGIYPIEQPTERVFRGVKVAKRATVGNVTRQGVAYVSAGDRITPRNIEGAIAAYTADWNGQQVNVACHDLRRTYAKICKQAGMSWEGLRANMGHSSVTITEAYVGKDVDWSERVPNWKIEID
jgi:site-specific recombinase XerD